MSETVRITSIVLVGGGVIAGAIARAAGDGARVRTFGVRAMRADPVVRAEALDACAAADAVVYLAYHHRDLRFNLALLRDLLDRLRDAEWSGRLVFLNTQQALPLSAFDAPYRARRFFAFDLYTVAKRRQSRLLARHGAGIRISELFLPIVVGHGTGWAERLAFIAGHAELRLPDGGARLAAVLHLEPFVAWLLALLAHGGEGEGDGRRVARRFVYSRVLPFCDLLLGAAPAGVMPVIVAARHRFRYGSTIKANLIGLLRASPVGLLLSLLKGLRAAPDGVASSAASPSPRPGRVFMPGGADHLFMDSSIRVERLPFPATRVG